MNYNVVYISIYYFQVQAQLSVCGKIYCDFVCWTTASMHVERFQADPELIDSLKRKLSSFVYEVPHASAAH